LVQSKATPTSISPAIIMQQIHTHLCRQAQWAARPTSNGALINAVDRATHPSASSSASASSILPRPLPLLPLNSIHSSSFHTSTIHSRTFSPARTYTPRLPQLYTPRTSLPLTSISTSTVASSNFRRHFANFADSGVENDANKNGQQKGQQQQQQQSGQDVEDDGNWKLGLVVIGGVVFGGAYYFFGPERKEGEAGWGKWFRNIFYGDSPLLPPETLDANGRRPRTVVINFDKTIVHCHWTRAHGWEVRKRPGVDRFLERAARAGFELVLWANQPQFEVEPTLQELDPGQYIRHKLYSEHTAWKWRKEEGGWFPKPVLVRDLNRLNRDKRRLVVIDCDTKLYTGDGNLTENVVVIPEFVDDINDPYLKNVTMMLENIQRYNIHDVQSVIARFNANPNGDLFVKEREAAQAAIKNLKGAAARDAYQVHGGVVRGSEDDSKEGNDSDEKQKQKPKQGWGSWVKGLVKQQPTTAKPQPPSQPAQ